MKRLGFLFLVALVVGAFLAGPAWAEVTYNEKEPFEMFVYVDCANGGAGEWVYLSGVLHVKFSFTENGNTYHFTSHYQPMGVTGVGEETGDTYRATGGTRSSDSGSFAGYPWRYKYINNFRIIGPGPGNNFTIHETIHITVNANGQLTVDHGEYNADCK